MDGRAIRRDEADDLSQGDPHNVWNRFNGREIATLGNTDEPLAMNNSKSVTERTKAPLGSAYTFYTGRNARMSSSFALFVSRQR